MSPSDSVRARCRAWSRPTFIAEYAPDRRRGFFGSRLEFGTLIGYAFGATIATMLSATLPDDALVSGGWRIPFLVALPLGAVGLYRRQKLDESPAFTELQSDEKQHGTASMGA